MILTIFRTFQRDLNFFGLFWMEGEGGWMLHIVKKDRKVDGIQIILFQSHNHRKLHNILFIKEWLVSYIGIKRNVDSFYYICWIQKFYFGIMLTGFF